MGRIHIGWQTRTTHGERNDGDKCDYKKRRENDVGSSERRHLSQMQDAEARGSEEEVATTETNAVNGRNTKAKFTRRCGWDGNIKREGSKGAGYKRKRGENDGGDGQVQIGRK